MRRTIWHCETEYFDGPCGIYLCGSTGELFELDGKSYDFQLCTSTSLPVGIPKYTLRSSNGTKSGASLTNVRLFYMGQL